jgi:hypothetical protein
MKNLVAAMVLVMLSQPERLADPELHLIPSGYRRVSLWR